MHTIEVDFQVLKALMARRETESVTYNEVIRRLLGLANVAVAAEPTLSATPATSRGGEWVVKGVPFPAGTEFRANYKGQIYTGLVQAGRLVVANKGYDSPSAAAVAITGSPVNGWTFWECRRPGDTGWKIIKGLRRGV